MWFGHLVLIASIRFSMSMTIDDVVRRAPISFDRLLASQSPELRYKMLIAPLAQPSVKIWTTGDESIGRASL
ncbi:uncharacterized protein EDB91DRAFT_1130367, partial [Suillus paluster]|uniref:uncharacterized protein n=1 Tax=Suillus paluster TaxID=48578 RepID=UPI001B8626CD